MAPPYRTFVKVAWPHRGHKWSNFPVLGFAIFPHAFHVTFRNADARQRGAYMARYNSNLREHAGLVQEWLDRYSVPQTLQRLSGEHHEVTTAAPCFARAEEWQAETQPTVGYLWERRACIAGAPLLSDIVRKLVLLYFLELLAIEDRPWPRRGSISAVPTTCWLEKEGWGVFPHGRNGCSASMAVREGVFMKVDRATEASVPPLNGRPPVLMEPEDARVKGRSQYGRLKRTVEQELARNALAANRVRFNDSELTVEVNHSLHELVLLFPHTTATFLGAWGPPPRHRASWREAPCCCRGCASPSRADATASNCGTWSSRSAAPSSHPVRCWR